MLADKGRVRIAEWPIAVRVEYRTRQDRAIESNRHRRADRPL